MNLKLYGRLGWQWQHSNETWHTGKDDRGLYCGRVLMDAEFIAPRDRVKMLRLIKGGK